MSETEILLTIKLQQQLFVEPKRIRLLKEIQQCGSINQAAKNAGVSYKSAWDHLEMMNKISPKPLLERNTGGKNGGGTALTHYARRLLQLYDLLEQTQQKAFEILQDESVPLGSLLSATARFSLQSSARNQFFGKVSALRQQDIHCYVSIESDDFTQPLIASITQQSAVRLQLVSGKEVMAMIKAPWIKIYPNRPDKAHNCFPATVNAITDKGEFKEIILTLGQHIQCCATASHEETFTIDQEVYCYIDPEQIVLVTLY
ncbi:TOBE domain-containing protein [Caviibacterium pharyngocola]|uniref:Molybdenum-dependent transcriptional regulator n=1 Tax=Caviibacterium pharyngocola TaxID=28159 RepID=A0A2M8RSX1_9PAST|nr:TOBE domain-containing protein [Caviibacterium pharyngocola]PJG81982.1 molybdenum-dependent transcriptional regulator [Caviibacterium pharyngocola]